jgi:hypothetical protein
MSSICCVSPAPDAWHYLPILERKPGALRDGVPFREWQVPITIRRVRNHILKPPKGDRPTSSCC